MKANLKLGIWMVATVLISYATLAQGRHDRDRDSRNNDKDRYDDRYKGDRYDDRYKGDRYHHRNHDDDYRIVRQRPHVPYYNNPRRPSTRHTWIPSEYRWHRGGYAYVPGYWMVPPRNGMRYVPGYWQPTRGGYVWISGFWQGVNVNIGYRD